MSTSIDDLFPIPSSPSSNLIPLHWPGVNPESVAALREVLKDNHERWHAFLNDQGFHKYVISFMYICPRRILYPIMSVIRLTMPLRFGPLVPIVSLSKEAIVKTSPPNSQRSSLPRPSPLQTSMTISETKSSVAHRSCLAVLWIFLTVSTMLT